MVYLESHKQAFRLKLSPTLLSQLALFEVAPDDFVEFVYAQFHNIIASKPNCRVYGDKPIWVMRGYYPDTPVFFKLTVVKTGELINHAGQSYQESFFYYVRAREHKTSWRSSYSTKFADNRLWHNKGELMVMSNDIANMVSAQMENSLLDAKHETKPLIPTIIKAPKCMSPKGVKLFRYKKPSKRKKRET